MNADSLQLNARARALFCNFEMLPVVDSTNTEAKRRSRTKNLVGSVLLAEQQTAGRGRLGRSWHSPPNNLYLTFVISLAPAEAMKGFSIAMGVAVSRALKLQGLTVSLKWPNDILYNQRKLGGILIETTEDAQATIVGIGINLQMPAGVDIDQPWTDVSRHLTTTISRETLAGAILNASAEIIEEFSVSGLSGLLAEWCALDVLIGQPVTLIEAGTEHQGIAEGLDVSGALVLRTAEGVRLFYGGEVSTARRS